LDLDNAIDRSATTHLGWYLVSILFLNAVLVILAVLYVALPAFPKSISDGFAYLMPLPLILVGVRVVVGLRRRNDDESDAPSRQLSQARKFALTALIVAGALIAFFGGGLQNTGALGPDFHGRVFRDADGSYFVMPLTAGDRRPATESDYDAYVRQYDYTPLGWALRVGTFVQIHAASDLLSPGVITRIFLFPFGKRPERDRQRRNDWDGDPDDAWV
jgi:hypothetical protein